ncbi:MAG TPA: SDR family NAD(P)-dependent oxidoreductase [Steroidobacteraceae bacterium]|nr:SDR family NAD(P)-dependent oxidoreductase [Steroidobacteraceae bacterium]
MKDIDGKVAFITGGASGLGLGMAQAFVRAGMKVVVADIQREHLEEAATVLKGAGSKVHFLRLDVMDRSAFAQAADETVRVFGKVHVLCNNAGVGQSALTEDATYEDWDWTLGVNLGGVVNGVVSFLPKLRAHGEGGHIVNTSSMAGLIPLPGAGGIYSTSKFAVRGLSDSLRLNLGQYNIGVSSLCPGLTRSRIMQSEKTRPANFQPKTARPTARILESGDPNGVSTLNAGMDPVELGERVLNGIRRNDAYILTHGEFKEEVRELFEEILAAFPAEGTEDPGRLRFEALRREMTAAAKARQTR